MYNKTIIRFAICDIQNNQGRGKGLSAEAAWFMKGDVAALVRSHMNGLPSFESTIKQTKETMPLALKQ